MIATTHSSEAPALGPSVETVLSTGSLEPSALVASEEYQARAARRQGVDAIWSQRTAELLQLRRLEPDWDGLGAEAPPAALVDSAIALLRQLKTEAWVPPARVVAGPTGTVLFEWQVDAVYLEVEISQPYHAEWMLKRHGEPAVHWSVP